MTSCAPEIDPKIDPGRRHPSWRACPRDRQQAALTCLVLALGLLTGWAAPQAAEGEPSRFEGEPAPAQSTRPLALTPASFSIGPAPTPLGNPGQNDNTGPQGGNGRQVLQPPPGVNGSAIEIGRIRGPSVYRPEKNEDSGFGPEGWNGVEPVLVEALVAALPIGAPSPAMGDLIRRVLLTPGPLTQRGPYGGLNAAVDPAWSARFLALRLARLQEAGHIEDAVDLAERLAGAPGVDRIAARIQTASALLDGNEEDACKAAVRLRLESEEAFWTKLRAYCYILDGAAPAARLTASLLADRGSVDPLFDETILALSDGETTLPETVWQTSIGPLHYSMLRRAGVVIPLRAALLAEPAVQRALAMDYQAPLQDPPTEETDEAGLDKAMETPATPDSVEVPGPAVLALAAAEHSVIIGALEANALAHAYATAPAPKAALASPLEMIAELPSPAANALLYQVVERETVPAIRVELATEALGIARRSGSLIPVALVHGDLIAEIDPTPDLAWAGSKLGIAALVAGREDAAYRWRDVLVQHVGRKTGEGHAETAEALRRLNVALAVAAPRNSVSFAPRIDIGGWIDAADAGAIDANRLARELEILAALGLPLSPKARGWLLGRSPVGAVDLPSASLFDQLSLAVETRSTAQAVCLALILAGREGPTAQALLPLQAAVKALFRLGLEQSARRLALEALLAAAP